MQFVSTSRKSPDVKDERSPRGTSWVACLWSFKITSRTVCDDKTARRGCFSLSNCCCGGVSGVSRAGDAVALREVSVMSFSRDGGAIEMCGLELPVKEKGSPVW